MKAALAACVVLAGLAGARPADACDRASSPLDDAATAVAVADAVVFIELRRVDGGIATGSIIDVVHGGGGAIAKGKEIHIRGPLTRDEAARDGRRCGVDLAAPGQQYLAVLWSPVPGTGEYHLVSPGGQTLTDDPARIAALSRAVRNPAAASAWRIHDELATRLVLEPAGAASRDELALHVVVRNLSKRRRPFVRTPSSRCELVGVRGRPRAQAAERTEIVPGEAVRIALGAAAVRPGRYAITARCTRFAGATTLATEPLVVTLP